MKYTREQQIALSTDRYISVTANAGSGKTKVLVDRYFNILLNGDSDAPNDSRSIAAITFTRKAAGEMLAKVVRTIEKEMKNAEDNTQLRKLKRIRENLIYARISTIHSFATSLLREFPIEAGILPTFSELNKADEIRLTAQIINDVIERRLDIPEKKEELFSLYQQINRNKVTELIRAIIGQAENFKAIKEFYQKPNDEIYNFYIRTFYSIFFEKLHELTDLYYKRLKIFDIGILKKQEHINLLSELAKKLYVLNERTGYDNSIELKKDYNDLLEIFKTKFGSNGFKNLIFKGADKFEDGERNDLISQLSKWEYLFDCEKELAESIIFSKLLLEISEEVLLELDATKTELGFLDFNDMILKLNNLFDNADVMKQIKSKLKYLLVDEFQDTNPIQYELIRKLCPRLEPSSIALEDDINLFIVGDAKQSIYAFRSADVRVFNTARKDIQLVNQNDIANEKLNRKFYSQNIEIPSNADESEGVLNLSASFRLSPVVASFVNIVCEKLFNNNSSEFDIKYSPLVFARNVEQFYEKFNCNNQKLLDNDFGSVTFLFNVIDKTTSDIIVETSEDESDDENISDDQVTEADVIASFINDVVKDDSNYYYQDGDVQKKINYGDIAILARVKKGFKAISNSLTKQNIPFIINSGYGFYAAQEVLDVICYLKFLQNNNDDIAFASLLKSPFFGITDAGLLNISLESGETFWEKFENLVKKYPNSPDEHYQYLNAYNIIIQVMEIALRVPIVQLIYKILDLSEWFGAINKRSSAGQMGANIRKLIAFARTYEGRGFKNLFDFINDLELLTQDASESEAAFITGENVVNVMSIHSAKGLEFPMVILANTNKKPKTQNGYFVNGDFGINFRYPVKNENNYFEDEALHSFKLAEFTNHLAEIAEEKRIIYVAMTRAKEHLVISGDLVKGKNGWNKPNRLLNMVFEGLDFQLFDFAMPEEKTTIERSTSLLTLTEIGEQSVDISFPIHIPNYQNTLSANIPKEIILKELPEIIEGEVSAGIFEDLISATKLIAYLEDNEQYVVKYLLGLPDDENLKNQHTYSDDEENEGEERITDEELTGMKAGTYVHKILERINEWFDSDENKCQQNIISRVDKSEKMFNRKFSSDLKMRLISEPFNVSYTNLLEQFRESFANSKPEITYKIPFDYDFIEVTFDLLIQNKNSEWGIWDWKSNQVRNEDDKIALKNHYEIQMKLYSYFNYLLNKNQEQYTARLLFTRLAKIGANDEDWTVTYNWSKSDMENFKTFLSNLLMDMKKSYLN